MRSRARGRGWCVGAGTRRRAPGGSRARAGRRTSRTRWRWTHRTTRIRSGRCGDVVGCGRGEGRQPDHDAIRLSDAGVADAARAAGGRRRGDGAGRGVGRCARCVRRDAAAPTLPLRGDGAAIRTLSARAPDPARTRWGWRHPTAVIVSGFAAGRRARRLGALRAIAGTPRRAADQAVQAGVGHRGDGVRGPAPAVRDVLCGRTLHHEELPAPVRGLRGGAGERGLVSGGVRTPRRALGGGVAQLRAK